MSEKRVKRDELIGKEVITTDASLIGHIKDMGYDDGRPGIVVDSKEQEGQEVFIPTTQILAFGDVVIIKSRSACPKCDLQNASDAKFCVKCGTKLG